MSRYVSRTLAARKQSRGSIIATRVAICTCLLMLALTAGMTCYVFLGYTAQIAAHTHDAENTIGMIGIWAGIVSFLSLMAVPLVAAGLHE